MAPMELSHVVALVKILGPHVPSISLNTLGHTLGLAPTSSKWDLRTAITVNVLRKLMNPGKGKYPPIGKTQAQSITEPGVKGPMWIATATIPKPPVADGTAIRDAVCKAVDDMARNKNDIKYTKPDCADVEVEWTGYRDGVPKDERPPAISEQEKYKRLMAEPTRSSETTILYFHGGAYYLADPRTHRGLTSKLAKESKGRVCSVRYRLAPQTAFPGQLVDALMVYLSLIYPPEGSMHAPVSADKIVIGGDSAGGNLCMGLVQLLLQMHRTSEGATPVVRFYGRDVPVPLPAGAGTSSAWLDVSISMPSQITNRVYDYLPPVDRRRLVPPYVEEKGVWPTDPPRGDLFCDLSLLDHPLVSLVLAPSWENSCPLFMIVGEEMLADEIHLVASRAAIQQVKVQFEQYQAMPHCFQLLVPHLATAQRCLQSWGDWARRCVEEPETIKTHGVHVPVKGGPEAEIDVTTIPTIGHEEAGHLIAASKARRISGMESAGKGGPGPTL